MSLSLRTGFNVACELQVARVKAIQVSSAAPSLTSPAWACADRVRGNTRPGGAATKRRHTDRVSASAHRKARLEKHYQSRAHMAAMRAKKAQSAYYDEVPGTYQLALWRDAQ